ncbi:unnamed protein product [Brassicogethes aeneus]|uniref:BED-type domain-containing protein n=1 Tax=Brassicogethes aeneus TaxID=1431903 RepID=A0A9P0BJ27_BRAAE|nr:unnamed protein product [Brassicogethes aeneus]
MPSNRSFIWDYFDKDEVESTGRATCYKCRKNYKTSGNTLNLIDDLRRVHNIFNKKKPLPPDDTDSPCPKRYRLQNIQEFVEHPAPYNNRDYRRKKALDKALVDLILSDMQPFSIVAD